MARLTLSDLTTPLTRQQVQKSIYDVLAALGTNTTIWKPGSVVRTMIVGVSSVFAQYSQLVAQVARAGFLDLSEGPWLTIVAKYVYGVERGAPTYASGAVTIVNTGGGVYDFDPGDLVVAHGVTGTTYRNAVAFHLGVGDTVSTLFVATVAGTGSNATPSAITRVVTPANGGLTAANAGPLVGRDEQTDSSLRLACTERLGALSPFGPWDAYGYALRNATRPTGENLGITRARLVPDGKGRLTGYVATDSGGLTGAPDDPDTDLGIANIAVDRKAVPQCITATILSAEETVIAPAYTAWVYNTVNLSTADIKGLIAQKLSAFITAHPIGGDSPGRVYRDGLIAAIKGAHPAIFHCEVISPASDVVLLPSQVAKLGTPVANAILFTPPPQGFRA